MPVPEYAEVTAGGDDRLPGAGAPGEAGLRLGASLDLGEIAGLILEAAVPRFAGAAAVFALEGLLAGGEPDGRAQDTQVTARRLGTGFYRDGRQVPDAAFPAGEVIAFDSGSLYARCVRGGVPVVFGRPDGLLSEWAGRRPRAREILSRYRSFLAVPMTAGEVVAGFLVFARGPTVPPFVMADAAEVAGLAARAGSCIARACLFMEQQHAALALQRHLVPASPDAQAGIEVAGRCVAAPGQVAGGDWYDIIGLPGGRTGLLVGDAMGHGHQAAAAMAQLRAAAHALAELDLAPAEVLRRLDRTAAALKIVPFATGIYAVIDPGRRSCTVAGAGHLPPVAVLPDGTTQAPELPSGLPLGLGTAIYGQVTIPFPPGAVLALYTDGLVDSRTRSSETGLVALRSALAGQHGPLERTCDDLLRSLAPRPEDDITVVLARIPPGHRPLAPPPVHL